MLNRLFRYAGSLGARGVAGSLAGKLAGKPVLREFRRPELSHPVWLRLPSTDVDAWEQVVRQAEYAFAVRRTPELIVDAGSNIGLAALCFANRFAHTRVIAIECEPANVELLRCNTKPYPNVTVVHAALWDHDGEIEIVDPGLGQWGYMTSELAPLSAGAATTTVRAVSMPTLMREHGFDHIDVLKMDIEGAELEVLRASAPWIACTDTLIAELHERLKPGCEQAWRDASADFSVRWHRGHTQFAARPGACVIAPP